MKKAPQISYTIEKTENIAGDEIKYNAIITVEGQILTSKEPITAEDIVLLERSVSMLQKWFTVTTN